MPDLGDDLRRALRRRNDPRTRTRRIDVIRQAGFGSRQGCLTLIVGAVLALLLAGCGSAERDLPQDAFGVVVNVEGRQVPCVVYEGYEAGGVSCDWGDQ